ncbi:MAG: sulfotransferase [Pseudomonadota bacterium]
MRLDFLIAGFSKCGTTTLCDLLGQHPELFMAPRKDAPVLHRLGAHTAQTAFMERFIGARKGQRWGYGTIWATDHQFEEAARDQLLRLCPEVRLIFLARDPLRRIESSFREYHHNRMQLSRRFPYTLNAAFDRRPELLSNSCYAERYANYSDAFSPAQCLVILLEDLAADQAGQLRRCFEFLGVDADFVPVKQERLNRGTSKLQDTPALRELRRADPVIDAALLRIPFDIQTQFLPTLGYRRPFPAVPIAWSDAAFDRLFPEVTTSATRFLEGLGRPLSVWPRFERLIAGDRRYEFGGEP